MVWSRMPPTPSGFSSYFMRLSREKEKLHLRKGLLKILICDHRSNKECEKSTDRVGDPRYRDR